MPKNTDRDSSKSQRSDAIARNPENGNYAVIQFLTQQHIMAGTWDAWNEEQRKEHVRILVREAHKVKFNETVKTDEPVMVKDD